MGELTETNPIPQTRYGSKLDTFLRMWHLGNSRNQDGREKKSQPVDF